MELKNVRENFKKHGWVLIKNVFTETEIDQFRENIYETQKNGHKGDLFSNPLVGHLLYDDRMVKIFQEVLEGTPVYFGDSNYLIDNTGAGFHKDNPDRVDPNGPDWKGDYNLYRAGVYLENHTKDSGGLLLRDFSHETISITKGRPFNVPIEKGDVAVWNLRTTHSGNAMLFKLFPGLIINPKYYKLIPSSLFRSQKIKRIGLFMTIGRKGKHMDRYLKYLKSRQYAVNVWQNSPYDAEIIKLTESKGLEVMDLRPEMKDIPVESLNLWHADIPY